MREYTVSEEFYRHVYENSPDMICSVDLPSGEVSACNRTFADQIGASKDEVIGRSELEFYHPRSRPGVESVREKLLEVGAVENVEAQMVRDDGSVFDVSLSAMALREDGEIVGARSVLRDISDLKETERELRRRTERLEQSNEELEQFAYLASHDLQEPLRMVASYTQLLERRYGDELDEKAGQYIDYAVEGAKRMKDLINDLLMYSRVSRTGPDFESVDLEGVLEDVGANLQLRIEETEGEVEWGELPAVRGDATQLMQVFQNLVGNGIKFHGDSPPRVEIRAERKGERVLVEVEDNGIGFDTEHADRIFQIFQRLHKRGEFEGTGTGLAIVKKIVEIHGGSIRVESEEGVGTSFYVELPAA